MEIVTGDRYLESLVKFVENNAERLIDGTLVLKLNPVGLRYVQSRLEALAELEALLSGAPVDYLRAYVSDLGDHRALEQLRRILRLLPSLKVVSVLPPPARDPTPLSLLPFGRLKVLELRGCDLSTSAARGLLELRHTLEKLICHNSTDALRHVFASRIVEIKNSPQWNRLSFVSCAFNGLVLMDESLQLLPAVDTLDLSSNKFSKVDNLRKCTKLKHLDLGFNNLRTISSFGEVSCQIVKLVLRNNALTTLRGIQNLKSLEGLDVSYNIISNFSEIEIVAGLPSLQNLWLEGNPLCCARWYRAQIFSNFPFPDNLRLDGKKISTREFWKRQIIIASRQKRPASFGFYSPAVDGAELEGSINTKRKRVSRLVSIQTEDQSTFACSDQDSVSCDNEIQSKQDNGVSDEEAEIVDLMNRIELMKKERSALWLQEFKEWMDPAVHNLVDGGKSKGDTLRDYYSKNMRSNLRDHLGETSRYILDSVQASGDDSSTNNLESDNSFADTSVGLSAQRYFDQIGEEVPRFFMRHASEDSPPVIKSLRSNKEHLKSLSKEGHMYASGRRLQLDSFPRDGKLAEEHIIRPITAIDDIVESRSSSVAPGSPPHYQEDILHRRQNLEEEFLQLSAESLSAASSDSNTSCSGDDSSEFGSWIPQVDQSLIGNFLERSVDGYSPVYAHYDWGDSLSPLEQNGLHASDVHDKIRELGSSSHFYGSTTPAGVDDGDMLHFVKHEADWLEKKKCKRRPKRRIVSLSEESKEDFKQEQLYISNGSLGNCAEDTKDERCCDTNFSNSVGETRTFSVAMDAYLARDCGEIISLKEPLCMESDDQAMSSFLSKLADFGVHESCQQFVQCRCLLQEKSGWTEREVGVLLSSKNKMYVGLVDGESDGSAMSLDLIGCHCIEDVREVYVGLGLQVIRVSCKDTMYLFVMRSTERSRKLLCMFDLIGLPMIENNCSLKSVEQIQVDLFERDVCGGSKMSIYQYSMVLFWHNSLQEDQWLSRSIFVLKHQLFVCIEDLKKFSSLSGIRAPTSYFFLDSSCSIIDISEMVIDMKQSYCVTLGLDCSTSKFCSPEENTGEDLAKGKLRSGPSSWKLKWFSEESLYKFVSLLEAIHSEASICPIQTRFLT